MDDHELLDRLIGTWRISGTMRGAPLAQRAVATWTLGGAFVEVRVTEGTPLVDGKPYEAVYFIGSPGAGSYAMTLVDVFGAAYAQIPGIGRREGDAMVFEFAYGGGPWTWRWTYASDTWEHEQTYVEDGRRVTFATKRMERAV